MSGTVFQDAILQGRGALDLAVAISLKVDVKKEYIIPFQQVTSKNVEEFFGAYDMIPYNTFHMDSRDFIVIPIESTLKSLEIVPGNHEIGDYCIGVTNLRRKGRPLNELVSPGGVYVRQSGSLSRTLKELCEEMFELEGTDDGGKLAAQFLFNAFLALVLRAEEMPRVEMVRSEELRRGRQIREYLDHHFAEEITLESVGEALGCSATYVSHTFKYYLGITPTQYMK